MAEGTRWCISGNALHHAHPNFRRYVTLPVVCTIFMSFVSYISRMYYICVYLLSDPADHGPWNFAVRLCRPSTQKSSFCDEILWSLDLQSKLCGEIVGFLDPKFSFHRGILKILNSGFCFALGSWRYWFLNVCFVVGSWRSYILTSWCLREIL